MAEVLKILREVSEGLERAKVSDVTYASSVHMYQCIHELRLYNSSKSILICSELRSIQKILLLMLSQHYHVFYLS